MKKYIEIVDSKKEHKPLGKNPGCLLVGLLVAFFPYRPNEQDKVRYWLLEFEIDDYGESEIKREIGLDENKVPILKLPNERNELGYWMDEDVDYDYFKNHFEVKEISKEHFLKLWNV